MTSDNNRTGGLHGQDAVPADNSNDPYSRDNPLVGEGQSAVPGGPLSDAYDAEPTVPPTRTGTGGGSQNDSTKSAAKHEAKEVGEEGKQAGKKVAGTAKEEASNVAGEAKDKAKDLVSELGDDVKGQAATQQQKAADGLRSISDELGSMASNSQEQGMATHLVQQAASRTGAAADWLGDRDPGSLLDEVKSFARKRPGTFLAIAAGAGLLVGRFSRGAAADTEEMEREDRQSHRHQPDHRDHYVDHHAAQDRVGSYERGAGAPRDPNMPGGPVPPVGGPVPAPGAPVPPNGGPVPLAGGSVPPDNGPVPPVDDPRREDYL